MPLYSYLCPMCAHTVEELRSVAHRHDLLTCERCGSGMSKEMARPYLDIIEPYFDEGLGVNIYSARHRREVMQKQGVIEAGDRVGGARNFDKHAPHHVGKFTLQKGCDFAEPIHREQPVETVDKSGAVVERATFDQLKGY